MKIESIENGVQITVEEKENYTLEELKQKLINNLYISRYYTSQEIELLRILLEYTKKD